MYCEIDGDDYGYLRLVKMWNTVIEESWMVTVGRGWC